MSRPLPPGICRSRVIASGFIFLNAVYNLRDIVGLTHELDSRYFLEQVHQAFHHYFRIIDNEDSHA